jgi:phosphopantetheinyl transferase
MSLVKIEIAGQRAWGLWRVQEEEQTLIGETSPYESIPSTITNEKKRLEFAAGRALVKHIAEALALSFTGIAKDSYGKPSLKGSGAHVSLSHSWPYVASIIALDAPVGIDLEQPKEKLLRVAHRVLNPVELRNAGDDVVKHCIYWCAKETLVKIHGKKDLVFAENLEIRPFEKENEGNIIGSIIVNNKLTTLNLKYSIHDDFVVVFNE